MASRKIRDAVILIKNIRAPEKINVAVCTHENKKILMNKAKDEYIIVPNSVKIFWNDVDFRVESTVGEKNYFDMFCGRLTEWLSPIRRMYRKKLYLKGLGYKATLLDNLEHPTLDLKLGFSHPIQIEAPLKDEVFIRTSKNLITIKGYNAADVGNFAGRIRHLRVPDPYKQKGVWYQGEVRKIKVVKKK